MLCCQLCSAFFFLFFFVVSAHTADVVVFFALHVFWGCFWTVAAASVVLGGYRMVALACVGFWCCRQCAGYLLPKLIRCTCVFGSGLIEYTRRNNVFRFSLPNVS